MIEGELAAKTANKGKGLLVDRRQHLATLMPQAPDHPRRRCKDAVLSDH